LATAATPPSIATAAAIIVGSTPRLDTPAISIQIGIEAAGADGLGHQRGHRPRARRGDITVEATHALQDRIRDEHRIAGRSDYPVHPCRDKLCLPARHLS